VNKRTIAVLKLLRPTQWLKSAFLFAPLIFSKHLFELMYFWQESLAFVCFCLISSIVYIINDMIDREADKLHPVKRNRPLATGIINSLHAIFVIIALIILLLIASPYLNSRFWLTGIIYTLINIAYSFWLKQIVLVDVFIVAAGFMLRVLAGVFAIDVVISPWLVLCTLFVSIFLAVSKRRSELILSAATDSYDTRPVLKLYDVAFMDQIITIAGSGMAISYALYTVAERTVMTFSTENLIFTTVFVLFGVFRYIFLLRNHKIDDNPMHILLSDLPMIVNVLAWFLSCVLIIYSHDLKMWIF
jgi:4-hydroxybenzoate polyprenyltransferase